MEDSQPSAVPKPLAAPVSLHPMASLDLTPEKEKLSLKSHATFLNKSKALHELNIPQHISRYSHLQQIDISDTSFEQLLVKTTGTKGSTNRLSAKTKSSSAAATSQNILLPKPDPKTEGIIREQPYWEKFELSNNKPHPILTPPTLYHDVLAADNNNNILK